MIVELHILQNFAPANLNRDDTGQPKDCEFGGHRRARISSQCFKRAIRNVFKNQLALPTDSLAFRSKRLNGEVRKHLIGMGHDTDEADKVTQAAFGGLGIIFEADKDGEVKSQYLVYAGKGEIQRFAEVCHAEWDNLRTSYDNAWAKNPEKAPGKDAASKAVGKATKDKLIAALDGGKASDLALFGRMLADLPDKNVDAASQVAHAISTNKVSMEFDYFTAVDDLKPGDQTGADMIGTVGFNSACFYRYANVDMGQLNKNLGYDDELTMKTLDAFLRASVDAVPTGKQNSMAAHNPPSFVLAVVRDYGHWNLANAFLRPVRPWQDKDLVLMSIEAFDSYWGKLAAMYGEDGIISACAVSMEGDGLSALKEHRRATLEELYRCVAEAAKFNGSKGG